MSTYRFRKTRTWDEIVYLVIEKKSFWGWKEVKRWNLYTITPTEEEKKYEVKATKKMMEAVDRLVKAGHTVI